MEIDEKVLLFLFLLRPRFGRWIFSSHFLLLFSCKRCTKSQTTGYCQLPSNNLDEGVLFAKELLPEGYQNWHQTIQKELFWGEGVGYKSG